MDRESSHLNHDRLGPILADYLTRFDQGESISREELLARHPAHVADLERYFSDVDFITRLATNGMTTASDGRSESAVVDPASNGSGATSATRESAAIPQEFGDYELLNELGRGGMGIVYRARERSTGRLVALKMLLHGRFMSPAEVSRFRNEVRTAAAFRHPGIVPIYHVGEHQGQLFYTMPIIQGTNLAQRLASVPLEPAIAAELLVEIARAVDCAHAAGVIHRDLKPANILLDEHDRPHVADFGLARQLGEAPLGITLTGDLLGTPNYMAPEQVSGSRTLVGPPTDVYALGAVLYALLVGQPPFHSDSVAETLLKIGTAEPVQLRQINRRVPRDLETICLKCLEKSPAARYQTAAALADDLRRFLAGEPLYAQRISRIERGRRWFVRNPVVGTLAVGIVLALIAGTGFSLHYARQSQQREQTALANLYAADMNLAQQHMRAGAVASALRLLERHRPQTSPPTSSGEGLGEGDQPNWEWRHLWHQAHGELRRFEGPTGAVYCTAFSPDGTIVAAAGADKMVWLWETATGKLLHSLPLGEGRVREKPNNESSGHTATIRDLAFSPDGRRLATVGDDRLGIVWETATGERIATLTVATGGPPVSNSQGSATAEPAVTTNGHEKPLTTVAFSHDGRLIATAGNDEANVNLWDATTYTLQQSLDIGPAESLAFAPDADRLAIAGRDGSIRVCQPDKDGSSVIAKTIQAHADVIHDLAWSPDGTRLATAGADRAVKLWDASSWSELASFGPLKESAYSVSFSPDGKRLVAAVRNEPLKVWDIDEQQIVAEMTGHSALVTCVDVCPDGWRLVSASEDGTVRLWDAARSTDHDRLEGHRGHIRSVAFSPDGNTLATGAADGAVILWNPTSCQPRSVLRSDAVTVSDLTFSPDGAHLAAAEFQGHLRIWSVEAGTQVADLPLERGPSVGVAWTPDGSRLAILTIDGAIQIVQASDGRRLATWLSKNGQTGNGSIAFSEEGTVLVTAGGDHIIRVWNIDSQTLIHELHGHTAPVVNAVLDPQSAVIASASNDHTVRLWDLNTGRSLRTLTGHSGTPYGLAFTPDGKRLASSSADQTVKLWDVLTGLELQSLVGHTDWVRDVAFSPDGQCLASAGYDGSLRLWHGPNQAADSSAASEAAALVKHLAASVTAREPLVAAIEADQTISDVVRSAAIDQTNEAPLHWPSLLAGHRAAERLDWAVAIDAFDRVTTLAPDDVMHWHWLAMASLAAGQRETYQRACDELLRRIDLNVSDNDLEWTLRTWLALPHDDQALAHLRPVVDGYARHFSDSRKFVWLYELRCGNTPSEALDSETSPATLGPQPENWYVVAMVYLKLGNYPQALSAYQAGARTAQSGRVGWDVDLFHQTLRSEVEDLLDIETFPNTERADSAVSLPSDPPSSEAFGAPNTQE